MLFLSLRGESSGRVRGMRALKWSRRGGWLRDQGRPAGFPRASDVPLLLIEIENEPPINAQMTDRNRTGFGICWRESGGLLIGRSLAFLSCFSEHPFLDLRGALCFIASCRDMALFFRLSSASTS